MSEVSTKNSGKNLKTPATTLKGKAATTKGDKANANVPANAAAAYASVKPLLLKNTCLACHNPNTRQVGPAYAEVAKRGYSVQQLINLIHNPKPEHWSGYSTPMPPMPQVPNDDARKIAVWIKSLEKGK
jgi:cytochrome c551/c552